LAYISAAESIGVSVTDMGFTEGRGPRGRSMVSTLGQDAAVPQANHRAMRVIKLHCMHCTRSTILYAFVTCNALSRVRACVYMY